MVYFCLCVHQIYHMWSVTHVNLSFCESLDTVSLPSPPFHPHPHPPDLIHPLILPDILASLSHLTFLTLVFVAQTASHLLLLPLGLLQKPATTPRPAADIRRRGDLRISRQRGLVSLWGVVS